MSYCVIKYEYRDGKKLSIPETWCGKPVIGWRFKGAQHLALSGGSVEPCRDCAKSIIEAIARQV